MKKSAAVAWAAAAALVVTACSATTQDEALAPSTGQLASTASQPDASQASASQNGEVAGATSSSQFASSKSPNQSSLGSTSASARLCPGGFDLETWTEQHFADNSKWEVNSALDTGESCDAERVPFSADEPISLVSLFQFGENEEYPELELASSMPYDSTVDLGGTTGYLSDDGVMNLYMNAPATGPGVLQVTVGYLDHSSVASETAIALARDVLAATPAPSSPTDTKAAPSDAAPRPPSDPTQPTPIAPTTPTIESNAPDQKVESLRLCPGSFDLTGWMAENFEPAEPGARWTLNPEDLDAGYRDKGGVICRAELLPRTPDQDLYSVEISYAPASFKQATSAEGLSAQGWTQEVSLGPVTGYMNNKSEEGGLTSVAFDWPDSSPGIAYVFVSSNDNQSLADKVAVELAGSLAGSVYEKGVAPTSGSSSPSRDNVTGPPDGSSVDIKTATVAIVDSFNPNTGVLAYDKVDYYTGEDAVTACKRDGVEPPGGAWCTEYYFTNVNPSSVTRPRHPRPRSLDTSKA